MSKPQQVFILAANVPSAHEEAKRRGIGSSAYHVLYSGDQLRGQEHFVVIRVPGWTKNKHIEDIRDVMHGRRCWVVDLSSER